MRNLLLGITAVLTLASGCYLGRSPTQKRNAKVLNGVAIAFGGVVTVATLASGLGGTACNGDCCSGASRGSVTDEAVR